MRPHRHAWSVVGRFSRAAAPERRSRYPDITGSIAVTLGPVLIMVGLGHHENVIVPALAVIGGALVTLVLGYDFTSARRRKRDLEGPDAGPSSTPAPARGVSIADRLSDAMRSA